MTKYQLCEELRAELEKEIEYSAIGAKETRKVLILMLRLLCIVRDSVPDEKGIS